MTEKSFRVDTQLFRELGEMLVGRDSTALAELVKNSYDADATVVRVYGESLDDPARGFIQIIDDGVGMDAETFDRGFLTIASRERGSGDRRSVRFDRAFTGAKGIGRLAAHKLARHLEVNSVSQSGAVQTQTVGEIDWDILEEAETLDQVLGTGAVNVETKRVKGRKIGTVITLRRLRRAWSAQELSAFIEEVRSYQLPPLFLGGSLDQFFGHEADSGVLLRDVGGRDPGFRVDLAGEFEQGEEFWASVPQGSQWLLEVDASSTSQVRYQLLPNQHASPVSTTSRKFETSVPRMDVGGTRFGAQILIRDKGRGTGPLKSQVDALSGIRVYMEGFRVLPYGESGNDWLGLDRDYTRRSAGALSSGLPLPDYLDDGSTLGRDALLMLPGRNFHGAVLLTRDASPGLEMLVNREGFLPSGSFDDVANLVRSGIDWTTRIRAAVRRDEEDEDESQARLEDAASKSAKRSPTSRTKTEPPVRDPLELILEVSASLNIALGQGDVDVAKSLADQMAPAIEIARSDRREWLVVASVGLQMARVVHELNAGVAMSQGLEYGLAQMLAESDLDSKTRQRLSEIHGDALELRQAIERQASYLVDVTSLDARRRRSRQRLHQAVTSALHLVQRAADDRGIRVTVAVPEELRSTPMFRSEIVTALANLLTNAIKACEAGGKVRVSAKMRSDQRTELVVANTGVAVELDEAEKWFKPFESTTTDIDPLLGQGMGLGLPITRSLLEQTGASLEFIKAPRGYATAIRIRFGDSA